MPYRPGMAYSPQDYTFDLGALVNARGVVRLETKNKIDALEILIEALARRKEVTSKEKLRRAIKDREKILSTGIGHCLAVPHAKIAQVKEFCMVVGLSKTGIPFDSQDGRLVHIIFMIAAPELRHTEYLSILGLITRYFRDEQVRNRLLGTKDTKSAVAILTEAR
ncbi:MAG: PTS sugar transporter subunit IIA [Planctomycetota bacterium]